MKQIKVIEQSGAFLEYVCENADLQSFIDNIPNLGHGQPERTVTTRDPETLEESSVVLPAEFTYEVSDLPDQTLDILRGKRDLLLASTDKYLLADYPISAEDLVLMKSYRQYLRDVTSEIPLPSEPKTYAEFITE